MTSGMAHADDPVDKLDEVFGSNPPDFDYDYHQDPPEMLTDYDENHYDIPFEEEVDESQFDLLSDPTYAEIIEHCMEPVWQVGKHLPV